MDAGTSYTIVYLDPEDTPQMDRCNFGFVWPHLRDDVKKEVERKAKQKYGDRFVAIFDSDTGIPAVPVGTGDPFADPKDEPELRAGSFEELGTAPTGLLAISAANAEQEKRIKDFFKSLGFDFDGDGRGGP